MPDLVHNYRFYFDGKNFCQVEFHSRQLELYGKIYIHIDGLKLHNKDKLLKDCLKLIAIGDTLKNTNRKMKKVIILTDERVKSEVNKSWIGYVIKRYKIELWVIPLPASKKHKIRVLKEYEEIQRAVRCAKRVESWESA